MSEPFDLAQNCVALADGPDAIALEVAEDFWQTIDRRRELASGRPPRPAAERAREGVQPDPGPIARDRVSTRLVTRRAAT